MTLKDGDVVRLTPFGIEKTTEGQFLSKSTGTVETRTDDLYNIVWSNGREIRGYDEKHLELVQEKRSLMEEELLKALKKVEDMYLEIIERDKTPNAAYVASGRLSEKETKWSALPESERNLWREKSEVGNVSPSSMGCCKVVLDSIVELSHDV